MQDDIYFGHPARELSASRPCPLRTAVQTVGALRCSFTCCLPPAGEPRLFARRRLALGGPWLFTRAVVRPRCADHDLCLGQNLCMRGLSVQNTYVLRLARFDSVGDLLRS